MKRSTHRRKPRLVLLAVLTIVGGLLLGGQAFNQPDALAEAARIPNDQGPSPECAGVAASGAAQPDEVKQPDGHADHRGDGRASRRDRCHRDQGGPLPEDFVDIRKVAPNVPKVQPGRKASAGSFVSACGTNDNQHRNPDNFIVTPGVSNGAHHTHDYVGNVSTDGFSTNESLLAADTTCATGDKSTYFWPVLRNTAARGADKGAPGGGVDQNLGRILQPSSVGLEFRGNPQAKVQAMPKFLRIITGDAKATTNGPANARAQWTCTGFADRLTTRYPLCPDGSQVQRILDFASCWDGKNIDSANHRAHIVFPGPDGSCPRGTRAVPQLRMTLSYEVPNGREIALDSFPEQLHNPLTDHADFANVMPDSLMATVVDCVNRGRKC